MSIEVANESGVAVDEPAIASVARHVLAAMQVNPAAELSIMVVTTEVMTELHERWMDEPGPTDVMAFPMDELVDESRRPGRARDRARRCSATSCSAPRSPRRRPGKAGHGLADELHLLTVHGVLHLLGYDHAEPEQEREMFGLQNALLADWQSARHEAAAREAQRRARLAAARHRRARGLLSRRSA